ncbi:uncharacterized protein LOC141577408 [Camelus bactrianus]|uniref:Uncharacterized protein LOC141577408 n=1 Tax=Camelus bactrianus TaxID=9837 RepID=A0AC58Q5I7_CAMBA
MRGNVTQDICSCPGAPSTAVQGQVCTCRLSPQPGSPVSVAGVPFPSPTRESSPPGLPLLGRRPVPAPGRAVSRAGGVCGPGRGRAAGAGAGLRAGLQPAYPPPLSLPRDPGAALLSLSRPLGTSSVASALLPRLSASGCKPQLLLVESGKWSVSAERASVSSLSVSAPDELADVVAWAKLRTQMPAPCHSQAGSIPVTCHLLLSPQASVNVGTSVQRGTGDMFAQQLLGSESADPPENTSLFLPFEVCPWDLAE